MSDACYTRSLLVQFESRLRYLPAILRLSVVTLSSEAEYVQNLRDCLLADPV